MPRSFLLFLFACIIFVNKASAQYTFTNDILICDENTPAPANCRLIDEITAPGPFYGTSRSKQEALKIARLNVLKAGGNILQIDEISTTPPTVHGHIYYMADSVRLKKLIAVAAARVPDTVSQKLVGDTARYAVFYMYIPLSGAKYTVYANDRELWSPGKMRCHKVKCYNEGLVTIWAPKNWLPLETFQVRFGKAYFIKLENKGGPLISVVSPAEGYKEYMFYRKLDVKKKERIERREQRRQEAQETEE